MSEPNVGYDPDKAYDDVVRNGRRFGKALAVVLVFAVLFYFFFPPWQAVRRYNAGPYYSWERCQAASDAASEYASFGLSSLANEWREEAEINCLLADGPRGPY